MVRLIIFACGIVSAYIFFRKNNYKMIFMVVCFFIVLFLCAVNYHNSLLKKKRKNKIFLEFSEKGLKRIKGEFKEFEDTGEEFEDLKHKFSSDLDIFGNNSLFQYINTTVTNGGRNTLSSIISLKEKILKDEIVEKQQAVKELSEKIEFRREFYAKGKVFETQDANIKEFIDWNKNKKIYTKGKMFTAMIFIIVMIISVALCLNHILPESFLLLNLLVNYAVIKILCSEIREEIALFEKLKKGLSGYVRIFNLIENEKFESHYLNKLCSNMSKNNVACTKEMKKLSDILVWCGNSKYNAYYFILNVLFFADVFLLRKLYLWKEKNSEYIEEWIDVINKIDALNSISNLAFENSTWTFPTINDNVIIRGKNIAHPLIGEKAVKNDFALMNDIKAALITGSNMSGKSTFLRTVGINMVLAYIGAPVCAEEFTCSIREIYTCMRTKDDLEENISSFYAEILRIKMLINACKNKEKVFFLLDEIFKGTNSEDRHTGASVLIKQLLKYGGAGLVSTHDLELCDLENNNVVVNYNFREYYENGKIKFDYKIRKGRSETRNAVHLMKLAGIEI